MKFSSSRRLRFNWLRVVASFGWLAPLHLGACVAFAAANSNLCELCERSFSAMIYVPTDEVTSQKRRICEACVLKQPACFLCGLPALPAGRMDLPDGRVICARDSQDAILSEQEAVRLCDEVRTILDRQLSRFMTFPETNVTVSLVDRVTIQGMFKFAGNDYACPNVWGFLESKTNGNRHTHQLSVLAGLPRTLFRSTCAHELTHAWVHEQVSATRLATLGRDAHEGFCELISHLLAGAENDRTALRSIEKNAYTRGQMQLFVAAERQFGMNDVVDWVRYGMDRALQTDNLGRIREVRVPGATSTAVAPLPVRPESAPETPTPGRLILRAVSAGGANSWAQINNRSFRLGEQWEVRVATSNVLVKCLAIHADSVVVELVNSREKLTLDIGAQ